jgi:hypothetical protein
MPWYRRRALFAGLGLLMLVNMVVLGSIWYNRSEADSTLTLTDREVMSPFGTFNSTENSGLSLRLMWRTESVDTLGYAMGNYRGSIGWLNAAKLAELGISVHGRALSQKTGRAYSNSVATDVLLVLEMDGPAYQRILEQTCKFTEGNEATHPEQRQRMCQQETNSASKLFVVDAGLDAKSLRNKYPDRNHYAIVHGQISASMTSDLGHETLQGRVSGLACDEVDVPKTLRAALGNSGSANPRYYGRAAQPFTAVVKFGRRLEPWLSSIALIPNGPAPQQP